MLTIPEIQDSNPAAADLKKVEGAGLWSDIKSENLSVNFIIYPMVTGLVRSCNFDSTEIYSPAAISAHLTYLLFRHEASEACRGEVTYPKTQTSKKMDPMVREEKHYIYQGLNPHGSCNCKAPRSNHCATSLSNYNPRPACFSLTVFSVHIQFNYSIFVQMHGIMTTSNRNYRAYKIG